MGHVGIQGWVMHDMNKTLGQDIIQKDLESSARSMAAGKAYGSKGVVTELILHHWHDIEGGF